MQTLKIQPSALAPPHESAQDRRMGWKENAAKFHRFVGGASSHITFWGWVIAVVGAIGAILAYLLAKANPALAYFAPYSYLVAVLLTLILLAWLARLLVGLIRSLGAPSSEAPDAPLTEREPPAPVLPPDSQEVIDAKRKLGAFVLGSLTNAIDEAREALQQSSEVIRAVSPTSPQAMLAMDAVMAASPGGVAIDVFNDWPRFRAESMDTLEEAVVRTLGEYNRAVLMIESVIGLTRECESKRDTLDFIDKTLRWFAAHRKLETETRALATDVPYSTLRARLKAENWFRTETLTIRDTLLSRHGLSMEPRLRGFTIVTPFDGAGVNHKERVEIEYSQEPRNLYAYFRRRDRKWQMQGPFVRRGSRIVIEEAHIGAEDVPEGTPFLFTVIQAPSQPPQVIDSLNKEWPRLPAIEVIRYYGANATSRRSFSHPHLGRGDD